MNFHKKCYTSPDLYIVYVSAKSLDAENYMYEQWMYYLYMHYFTHK